MITDTALRAALLKEYDYEVSGQSELLPLLKLMYDSKQISEKCLATVGKGAWLNRANFYCFEDNWKAFVHGLGQWGMAAMLAITAGLVFGCNYLEKMDALVENAKASKELTQFISYSSTHDTRRLKALQDAFNRDSANGLKIELFRVDSVANIRKR